MLPSFHCVFSHEMDEPDLQFSDMGWLLVVLDSGKADSTKIVLLNLFEDEHIAWGEDMQGTIR